METQDYERVCACALNRIFGYEPVYASRLMTELGSAAKVFSLSRDELYEVFGPLNKYREAINQDALEVAARELEAIRQYGCIFISRSEKVFPTLLAECTDCPAGIYVRSASEPEEIFNRRPAVSIVGTRDMSLYGKEWTPRIVRALADSPDPPVIVSGLAFGIDISAHMAALACGLPTIAVLPTGIDDIYPKTHRTAAEKIAGNPGSAIVTDYPPGTRATAVNFLRRNRLIAGISGSTILIESRKRGGGMMTARLASGYGRNVFALPGRIEDIRSEGCNVLIGEKVAEPVVRLADLPENAGLGKYDRRRDRDLAGEISSHFPGPESDEICGIAMKIKRHRGITPDELCSECDVGYSRMTEILGRLEEAGFIDIDLLQRCTIHIDFL